jgi:hypothetical protein
MRIGIDFDNTLVCYDQLFWDLARERGAIDESVPRWKDAIRDNLRQRGLEPIWTGLQGLAYGPRILDASPFPGALAAVAEFVHRGWEVFIISHKTQFPIVGAEYDLHEAARDWLIKNGLLGDVNSPLQSDQAYFELTKSDKLRRIEYIGCDWFIDDLPELLTDPGFPSNVGRILFDPHGQTDLHSCEIRNLNDWGNATVLLTKARM